MNLQSVIANEEKTFVEPRVKWMVVDDTETVLKMTAEMLAMLTEAEICCFQSAKKALRVFQADPSAFELVATDFDMPEMNGAELCHQLRAIAPKLKIILTTGSVNISKTTAFYLHFNSFLAKPFTMAAVSNALGTLIPATKLCHVNG